MNLLQRIERYLQNQNKWVGESTIIALARKEGYAEHATRSALRSLDRAPFAQEYRTGSGMYYRWYKMSAEEAEKINNGKKAFDQL
jgi:DNA-binding transcriptional regulator PaaX